MVRFLVLWNQPLDPDAFASHYRNVHIPLVKKLPGLLRYQISYGCVFPIRGEAPYYMVAELDWADVESFRLALESPEGRAVSQDMEQLTPLSSGVRSMFFQVETLHTESLAEWFHAVVEKESGGS